MIISYSQLNKLAMCPHSYKLRYRDRIKMAPSMSLIWGSSLHHAAQLYLSDKLTIGHPSKDEIYQALMLEYYYNKIKTEGLRVLKGEDKNQIIAENEEGLIRTLPVLIENLSEIEPEYVEMKFKARIKENISLVGYVDCIDIFGVIHDLKTGKKSKSQKDADSSMQLTAYKYLAENEGIEISGLQLDALTTLKTKVKWDVFKTTRTSDDYVVLANHIEALEKAIETETYTPNTNGWWCSPKCCEYYNTCKYVRREA